MLSQYPGDYPLPLVGNGLQLGFDTDFCSNKMVDLWKKHGGSNFRMTVGSEEWVLISNPDDVATILNHPTELRKQVERNTGMKPLFGNSLSTSDGARWKLMRKIIAPSFHFKTLDKNLETFNTNCDHLFKLLDEQNNQVVDIYRYMKPYMFNVVCNSLMGVELDLLNDLDNPYFEASDNAMKIITQNYFSYWRSLIHSFVTPTLYKTITNVINIISVMGSNVIARRREKIKKIIEDECNIVKTRGLDIDKLVQEKCSTEACLLDRLLLSKLYNGFVLSEDDVAQEVNLLCWTGHHSSTVAISHALYCIAKHPEVQNRIIEEQKQIFNNDIYKKPTNQDLVEMKYLEAVIKESMRFIPVINKISRHLQNDLLLKGFRFAWTSMKATISNVIRRYELSPGGPGTEPQFIYRLMTESKNGVLLKIKKRQC
ncbi:unnamed protein product [Leptosia nina]|uniref:Cytochrome P450 n=1 Tax=Leptosia nina TaxID=320188 RepID=A0AAV1JUJ8_9NEOP